MSVARGTASEADESARTAPQTPEPLSPRHAPAQVVPLPTASRLLATPQISGRGSGPVRAAMIQRMQQAYGNRAVQRMLQRHAGSAPASSGALLHAAVQRSPAALQRAPAPAATSDAPGPAPAPAPATPKATPAPASDPAVDALDLNETAKAAALALKALHPEITFTSGRRDVASQAHAMASNIVSSKNRNWIADTYASAAALQKWVDDHPEATTVAAIAAGLKETLDAMADSDRSKVSKHLGGAAFDVQPQEKDAEQIKKDIRALSGLTKFLEQEGGLVRWHAQF